MFAGFTRWRRRRIVARAMLADGLWQNTIAALPSLRDLDDNDNVRLRELVILFLHYKAIVGAGGLEVDERMRTLIAAQACILILNLDIDYYAEWVEVIVYPDEFVPDGEYTDENGIVHAERYARAGEAWLRGPVVLSWADVLSAGNDDGINVVIHEFAHKLDMLNGDANGYPPLHRGMSRAAWAAAFTHAYDDFCRRVDADEEGAIDPYAAESPGEFFAVASEAFFEIPARLTALYPDVYEQLRLFYRQDPLKRVSIKLVKNIV